MLADAMLAEAVRNGWLTPPVSSSEAVPPRPEPVAPLHELLAELQADRDER